MSTGKNMPVTDYREYGDLRKLLADYESGKETAKYCGKWALDALPRLLDENGRLISKLALANRALEEANQSITELEAGLHKYAQESLDADARLMDAKERIAQLEAALREIGECCAEIKARTAPI